MTRRDYIALARAIASAHEHNADSADYCEGWHAALSAVMLRIAQECYADNPRFDHERFYAACNARRGDAC